MLIGRDATCAMLIGWDVTRNSNRPHVYNFQSVCLRVPALVLTFFFSLWKIERSSSVRFKEGTNQGDIFKVMSGCMINCAGYGNNLISWSPTWIELHRVAARRSSSCQFARSIYDSRKNYSRAEKSMGIWLQPNEWTKVILINLECGIFDAYAAPAISSAHLINPGSKQWNTKQHRCFGQLCSLHCAVACVTYESHMIETGTVLRWDVLKINGFNRFILWSEFCFDLA